MKYMDFVVLVVAALIIGLAIWYIRRARKNGVRCIGCPDSKTCSGSCGQCRGCQQGTKP